MTNKQLAIFYCVFLGFGLVLTSGLKTAMILDSTTQTHADKVCQAIYGPQTQAIWGDVMQCQTARGEVLPVKKTKE